MLTYTNFISDVLLAPITQFANPNTRIYYLYLLTSLLMALIFYIIKRKNKSIVQYLFPKKVWLHPSAKMDYSIFIINGLISSLLIIPFMVSSASIFSMSYKMLQSLFGTASQLDLSESTSILLYTLLLWLFSDFTRFLAHYIMHKIPSLWEFHKVHHSAEVLTPFTQYRSHPVEVFIFNLRAVISIGFITAICTYFFSYDLSIVEVIGVNVFRFIFLSLGSNLRHSHISIRYGKFLEHIFISPAQHQIHHSNDPKHFDTNMGSHLAIWDWIFGTLQVAKSKSRLVFGLDNTTNQEHRNLWKVYAKPFIRAFKR